eukprot:GFUD01015728.1.p1 GENE.GFUD01015728.1~~GFUD01015728.1.p1  ORF type:complete len:612 (+),score=83.64 GFUD01015728.1:642-2477(+)
MGPPPYGRSLSQPYQKPLTLMERKMKEGNSNRKQSMSQEPTSKMSNALLVPEFSDFSNTFEVEIKRNSLGLGFSISGGPDAPSPWTNLIRVKKIFPLQPAWETGKLKIGDIILRVSGIPLSALNLRQALDILRTSPPLTTLQVCRVSDSSGNSWSAQPTPKSRSTIVRSYSYGPVSGPALDGSRSPKKLSDQTGRPPLPPAPDHIIRHTELKQHLGKLKSTLSICSGESMDIEISPPSPSTPCVISREWSPADDNENMSDTMNILKPLEKTLRNSLPDQGTSFYGEFTINLNKVNGSLGFTLRQMDDTVLKHTIKALVKEPAISDGRIRPGDKLLSANGVDLSNFSHQELISFLRKCPETNSLTLYRDASRSQTPLTPENSQFDFIASQNSLPNPSFESRHSAFSEKRTSQSPSRKHLRYEAAELVRSLQSSRTSLEKAGLGSNPGSYSSGTLGRRLGRPYSPGMKDKHLLLSPANPTPTIESPVTPHNSAPASLSQGVAHAFQNLKIDQALSIEEVDGYSPSESASGQYSPDIQEVISAPQSPSKELMSPNFNSNQSKSLPRGSSNHYLIGSGSIYDERPERPRDLNFGSQSRKQGYIFNNNWNANKNKF